MPRSCAKSSRDAFVALGGTIVGQGAVQPDQTDMSAVLAEIATGAPELIYYPIFMPAGAFIIRQAKETAGLEATHLMGADGLFSPDVVEGTGDVVEGFYVSSPDLSTFGDAYDALRPSTRRSSGPSRSASSTRTPTMPSGSC